MITPILLASLATAVMADDAVTVLGSYLLVRHGDRLAKPSIILSPTGEQEEFQQGTFFHQRYLNSSSPDFIAGLNATYNATQLTASVPNSDVLEHSQYAFLQGLYPPVSDIKSDTDSTVQGSSLSNGTTQVSPFGGYQYVTTTGVTAATADGIWLQGDTSCPAYTNASQAYLDSDEFKALNKSTFDFYQGLAPYFAGVIPKSKLNYGNAYTVYDHYLVESVHNETFYNMIKDKPDDFTQVKTLQDQYSRALNYNASNSNTTIGAQSLAGAVLTALNNTAVAGAPYITLAHDSYDVFYQMFGLLGLYNTSDAETFTGIVNYASAMVFELVEKSNQKYVRFGFRNGTELTSNSSAAMPSPPLNTYSILGADSDEILYSDFVSKLSKVAITNVSSWCGACGSWSLNLCIPYSSQYLTAKQHDFKFPSSKLSLAGAGGIGAGVTIGVFALAAALLFLLFRGRGTKKVSSGNSVNTVGGEMSSNKSHEV